MRAVLSLLFWIFIVVTSALLFPVALGVWALTAALDRRKTWLHRFTCFWASLYTWCNPAWSLTVAGRERVDPDETYVMVANHLSLVDIFVLFRLFTHYKWVSKIENFRLPFIGWNMSLNGYVKLRRGDRESVVQMMEHCDVLLREENSIMMFPEGTRSMDGKLRAFKPGAFELALRNQRPILPLLIEGTRNALPKRGFVLQGRHELRLTVLEPIPFESFRELSAEALTEHIHSLYEGWTTAPRAS